MQVNNYLFERFHFPNDPIWHAACLGNMTEMNILYNKGNKLYVHCAYTAALDVNIPMLEWLFEREGVPNSFIQMHAVSSRKIIGDPENIKNLDHWQEKTIIVLEWLKSKNIDSNGSIPIEYAASVDNILALEWIKNNHKEFFSYPGYNGIIENLEKLGLKETPGIKWLNENKKMFNNM